MKPTALLRRDSAPFTHGVGANSCAVRLLTGRPGRYR